MKKCVFILPYFGKFNNYFNLFLKSAGCNKEYDWLIITDDHENYGYPSNVRVIYKQFDEIQQLFMEKLGQAISLENPYKLCDFKPTYGLMFSEYIEGYEYWGHCDCDVLFGDLDSILTPLLEKGFDKLFPAGHMTIYKNTAENNRRFMAQYNGRYLYKEYLSAPEICWFDEDWMADNIHTMFLNSGASVYPEMLAFNPSGDDTFFVQRNYIPNEHKYEKESYRKSLLLWNEGHIYRYYETEGEFVKEEYLYLHLQHRAMKQLVLNVAESSCIRVLPERFVDFKYDITDQSKLSRINLEPLSGYLYVLANMKKKVRRKVKEILTRK